MTSSNLNPVEGSLRLVGGHTNNTGVLQVYRSRMWVGICANGLRYDSESLDVACRQLGYRSWVSAGSVFTYNVHYKYYCAINCLHEVCSNVNVRMYNFVVLNICIFLLLTYESIYVIAVLCGRCSVLDHCSL